MRILVPVIILILSICSQANGSERTEVIHVEVEQANYFRAKLKLEIFLVEEYSDVFVCSRIVEVSKGCLPKRLKKGSNEVEIDSIRSKNKDSSIISKYIQVSIYAPDGINILKVDHPLEIVWPGPEQAMQSLGVKEARDYSFPGAEYIVVDQSLENNQEIIRKIVELGFPIQKISLLGRSSRNYPFTLLSFDQLVELEAIRNIMDLVLSTSSGLSIGGYSSEGRPKILSEIEINTLKTPSLSDADFIRIVGIRQIDDFEKTNIQYEKAYSLIDTGGRNNLDQAETILEEIISSNDDFPRAYLELARIAMKRGQPNSFNKAEKLILTALDIDPNLADTYVLLGYVYTNQERFLEAEEQYVKAEEIGTSNDWLHANRGLNYKMMGDVDGAIGSYMNIINSPRVLGRNDRPRKWVYSFGGLFKLMAQTGKTKEADKLFDQYASEYSNYACIRYEQAQFRLEHKGDPEGAIESYLLAKKDGCRSKTPLLSIAYYAIWEELSKSSPDSKEAKRAFRKADTFAPNDSELFYEVAKIRSMQAVLSRLSTIKNIDATDEYGISALVKATQENEFDVVDRLLQSGSNPNLKEGLYSPPLIVALQNRNIEIIELLLKHGAESKMLLPGDKTIDQYLRDLGTEEVNKILEKRNSA